jgi:hypothetical protein
MAAIVPSNLLEANLTQGSHGYQYLVINVMSFTINNLRWINYVITLIP